MVARYRVIRASEIDVFHAEVLEVISCRQPNLNVSVGSDRILIEGPFLCFSDEGPYDAFDISIEVTAGFPVIEPVVKETFGRIPRHIDRHMFNSDHCCLGIWAQWLSENPDANFEKYLAGPVHDFFVSQSWYEKYDDWPFGQRAHGFSGQEEAFLEILGLPKGADASAGIRLLGADRLKGHHVCPCGSGSKLRDCHLGHLADLRERLDPFVILAMRGAEMRNRTGNSPRK